MKPCLDSVTKKIFVYILLDTNRRQTTGFYISQLDMNVYFANVFSTFSFCAIVCRHFSSFYTYCLPLFRIPYSICLLKFQINTNLNFMIKKNAAC